MAAELSARRLDELARQVGSSVPPYIAIQNDLLRFSFSKALGFAKPQPSAAAQKTQTLRERLSPLLEELRAAELSGQFAITLRAYLRQLVDAMIFFEGLCTRYARALETHDKEYLRRGGLKADLEALQQSERAYLLIGHKLNGLRPEGPESATAPTSPPSSKS